MASYDDMRKRTEQAEAATAKAVEEVAGGEAFGTLLARTAENAAALMGFWADACDTVVRNFRLAGRQDVARLGARISQTDDKLERVLQEIYTLQDELAAAQGKGPAEPGTVTAAGGRPSVSGRGAGRPAEVTR
jgi:hypothetical protein